ncbi:MAG: YncE family protein [Bacteroidales bacterium]|jgi:hypothetical protein|nr:YncE family protein [Bacteroidales bacterium]
MKTILKTISILFLALISSCEPVENNGLYPAGKGFFILNEGNYLAGNGSLSFYSTETKQIYNDLFSLANERALGDIPSFMAVEGGKGFIVVNNSGTVEAVDIHSLESLGTVTGLISPRQIVTSGGKGYISSLMSPQVTILDLENMLVSGNMDISSASEAMVIYGGRLFSAHWSGGNSVSVTDLATGEAITSITVGLEPESMVLDKNGKLWVLCTGGWMGEEIPRIVRINPGTLEKEKEFLFRTVDDNPSSLTSNVAGDTIYYLDEGVRRMPVTAESLPSVPFIPAGNRLFYRLMVCPGGIIAVTDAIDYQQKGDLMVYNSRGELLDTEQAGIIPGFMLYMKD